MEEPTVESLKTALRSIRDAAKIVRDQGWKAGSDELHRAINEHINAIAHSYGDLAPGLAIHKGSIWRDCDQWIKLYAWDTRGEFQEEGVKTARRLIERIEALLAALQPPPL